MELCFRHGAEEVVVEIERAGESFRARVAAADYEMELIRREGSALVARIGDEIVRASVAWDGGDWWVSIEGRAVRLERARGATRRSAGHSGEDALMAAMPGKVRAVLVAAGDRVAFGETLILLEAMKMELRVTAPHDGVVGDVLVAEGDVVGRGQVLVELEMQVDSPAQMYADTLSGTM